MVDFYAFHEGFKSWVSYTIKLTNRPTIWEKGKLECGPVPWRVSVLDFLMVNLLNVSKVHSSRSLGIPVGSTLKHSNKTPPG